MLCGTVARREATSHFENNTPPKAEMVAGLKAAFASCDATYGSMADTRSGETMHFLGHDRPKLPVLTFNTEHAWEHYENIVVYMRLKGLVPPASERSTN